MKKILILFLFMFAMPKVLAQEFTNNTTTFYLIRHAEKLRINPTDSNPDLNERGYLRADHWKKVLQHITFDAIYSTNYIRTLKTVEPIAISEELEIQLYQPTKIDLNQLKQDTKGKKVLMVGHSNTIPQFANLLINQEKYPEINDAEFSHLYIITITENQISDLLLYIDF